MTDETHERSRELKMATSDKKSKPLLTYRARGKTRKYIDYFRSRGWRWDRPREYWECKATGRHDRKVSWAREMRDIFVEEIDGLE